MWIRVYDIVMYMYIYILKTIMLFNIIRYKNNLIWSIL